MTPPPPVYAVEGSGIVHRLIAAHHVACKRDLTDVELTTDISDVDPDELCPACFVAAGEIMDILA